MKIYQIIIDTVKVSRKNVRSYMELDCKVICGENVCKDDRRKLLDGRDKNPKGYNKIGSIFFKCYCRHFGAPMFFCFRF